MSFIWKLLEKGIKAEITKEIEKFKDKSQQAVDRYEILIKKYGELFKGFGSPNQYLNFMLREFPNIKTAIIKEGEIYFSRRVVCYVDVIPLKKYDHSYVAHSHQNWVNDEDCFILGALDFEKETKGNIKIIIENTVEFVGYLSNEKWLPLIGQELLLVKPMMYFKIKAPAKPNIYVIRVEPCGKTIARG